MIQRLTLIAALALALAAFLLCFANSTFADVTAIFSTSVATGVVPCSITFTNTGSGWTNSDWYWDDVAGYNDGYNWTHTGSTNVPHIFLNPGIDHLVLTNTGPDGVAVTNGSIQLLQVRFSASPSSGSLPLTTTFTPLAFAGGTAYTPWAGTFTNSTWSFGDGTGTTNTTNATINHTYTAGGTYTVILTADGPLGSGARTNANEGMIVVYPFDVSPLTPCNFTGNIGGTFVPTNSYTITNVGTLSFNWTASKTASWLTLSATGGTLAGGGTTNILVSVNSTANGFTNGPYTDTLIISNATDNTGTTALPVLLGISRNWTKDWYAAPNGSAENTGLTTNSPLDIYTAFRLTNPYGVGIQGGDTLWLRGTNHGGAYLGGYLSAHSNALAILLNGSSNNPVVIRPYGEEYIVLNDEPDNAWLGGAAQNILAVSGSYIQLWDIEMFSYAATNRWTGCTHGITPGRFFINGLLVDGPNNKIINPIIHDTGEGVYITTTATNTEVYGGLVFNNGCCNVGDDSRGHGHAFYVKSAVPTTLLSDNIVHDQAGNAFQVYAQGDTVPLNGVDLERNIIFGNGSIVAPFVGGALSMGITIGGYGVLGADNFIARTNFSIGGNANTDIGYETGGACGGNANLINGTAVVEGNYFIGDYNVMSYWTNVTYIGNFVGGNLADNQSTVLWNIYAPPHSGDTNPPVGSSYLWDNNTYVSSWDRPWHVGCTPEYFNFSDWQAASGLDAHSTFSSGNPTDIVVRVFVNKYDTNRANVAVLNWPTNNTVTVDLSNLLHTGDTFQILNGQDPLSNAVVSGTYTGPVTLPMTNLTVAIPTGTNQAPSSVGPFFGVFMVEKTSSNAVAAAGPGRPWVECLKAFFPSSPAWVPSAYPCQIPSANCNLGFTTIISTNNTPSTSINGVYVFYDCDSDAPYVSGALSFAFYCTANDNFLWLTPIANGLWQMTYSEAGPFDPVTLHCDGVGAFCGTNTFGNATESSTLIFGASCP